MLSLAYDLKETVEIDGIEYRIDLSFDNVLRLVDMLNDDELDDATQIRIGLEMLLDVCFLLDIEKQAKLFKDLFQNVLGKGKSNQPVDIEGNPMPTNGDEERHYCLTQDAEYIYSSFMQDYRIDLIEMQGKLHWDKFNSLLSGLSEKTKFKEVVGIRVMEIPTGKGTAKEAKRVRELKKTYALKGMEIEE